MSEVERLRNLIHSFPQGGDKPGYENWLSQLGVFDARGLAPAEKERLESQIRIAMKVIGDQPYTQRSKHK